METWVPGAGRDEVALWRQLTLLMEQANATAGKRLTRCHGVSVNELLLLLPWRSGVTALSGCPN